MSRCCKHILGFFFLLIISTIINKNQLYAQQISTTEVEVIETDDDGFISSCITDGKLPKPIQPIKKKQSYKRILVSKRVPFTEASHNSDFNFSLQSITTFQVAIPNLVFSINSYSQALLKHKSLFYLF